jgi:NADH:ubiquinone oxidoreductase subunit 6 (subunit J)
MDAVARVFRLVFVDNWHLTLVLALGLVAVYRLLPRVPRSPAILGATLGGLALLLASVLLVRADVFQPEAFLFYAFSAIAVVGGALLVTQSNPVYAALSFVLVVLSTCGLFLLLAAPFLMAATIIIYAGAIIVIFLFVIMLAQQEGPSDADQRSREPLFASVAGFVLLWALLFVLRLSYDTGELDRLLQETAGVADDAAQLAERPDASREADLRERVKQLSVAFRAASDRLPVTPDSKELRAEAENMDGNDLAALEKSLERVQKIAARLRTNPAALHQSGTVPLSGFSGAPTNLPVQDQRRDEHTGLPAMPAENVAFLGRSLFTDYLLAVELGGTLLLVATIGAIAITHRRAERAS